MLKPIAVGTAIAGTLDILSAVVFSIMAGSTPIHMLQSVASGPFGDVALTSTSYAPVGLLVHFAIMACMVTAYMFAARQWRVLLDRPILAGALYGLLLWFVMYWVVLHLRFQAPHPSQLVPIAKQLFSHIILVGIPIGLVAARYLRSGGPAR